MHHISYPAKKKMSEKPKKYFFVDGVMKLNPAFAAYQNASSPTKSSTSGHNSALAVVSSMDDIMTATELQADTTGTPMQMAPSVWYQKCLDILILVYIIFLCEFV